MKNTFVIFLLACCLSSAAQSAYFVSFVGARLNADYKNVRNSDNSVSDLSGNLELIGMGGGLTTQAPGNFGYSADLAILGTNSQKLSYNPNWGIPWYYRIAGKANYTFSFGLFFEFGGDILGSFYQDAENHYLGVGANAGIGYKINEHFSVSVSIDNSSVLFAGENKRVLRGQLVQLTYKF